MANHKTVWTEAEDEMLKKFHYDRLSFSAIAYRINRLFGTFFTRNAAIGRANRLDLPARQPGGNKKPRRQGIDGALHVKIRTRPTRVNYFPVEANEVAGELPFKGLSLMELGQHDCRFPHGTEKITFCGQRQIDGSSYCEHHERLTHWYR